MWITADEAVVMFARFCRARLGKAASQKVRAKAQELKRCGDTEGHDIWNKVAEEIEKGNKSRQLPTFPPIRASVTAPITAQRANGIGAV